MRLHLICKMGDPACHSGNSKTSENTRKTTLKSLQTTETDKRVYMSKKIPRGWLGQPATHSLAGYQPKPFPLVVAQNPGGCADLHEGSPPLINRDKDPPQMTSIYIQARSVPKSDHHEFGCTGAGCVHSPTCIKSDDPVSC